MARSFRTIPTHVGASLELFVEPLDSVVAIHFFAGGAAEGDDVVYLDVLAIDHDAIDEQLDECMTLVELSLFETFADGCSEVVDARG
jgi:hypothetical protein